MNILVDVVVSPAVTFFSAIWPAVIAVAIVVIAAILIIVRIRKKRRKNKGE